MELHGATLRWRLTRSEQDRYELTRSASGGGADSLAELARWLASPPAGGRRGICATLIEWAGDG
jgi:hypothetical protein